MRTIGRRYPFKTSRGDYETDCDYCGLRYYRRQMTRDAARMLACPECAGGKDAVTLARENAESAAEFPGVNAKDRSW